MAKATFIKIFIVSWINPTAIEVNLYKHKKMENVLEKKMSNYFSQLNEQEKKSVVQMLKVFLSGRSESTKRISIEQYNIELDRAMEEVERGETYTHDEVIRMSKI